MENSCGKSHRTVRDANINVTDATYAECVRLALRRTYGPLRYGAQKLADDAGTTERTAQNWLAGLNAPRGAPLIRLMARCEDLRLSIMGMIDQAGAANRSACEEEAERPRANVDQLLQRIAEKKAELDRLRARAPGGLANFEHTQDLELTYTSNAIEGNTLTAAETMLVVEKGITIGGKPLKDHLEAIDHFEALRYLRALARETDPLTEMDVRSLHRLVMLRSAPEMAGRYADQGRYVLTAEGRHGFPSPAEVPALTADFARWLGSAAITPATAFAAHRRLVDIHPFNDGNGRTARLLMNLVLIRGGYPPVAVRPQDRPAYIDALQQAQAGRGTAAFDRLLYERLDATLGDYVTASKEALSGPTPAASRAEGDKPAP